MRLSQFPSPILLASTCLAFACWSSFSHAQKDFEPTQSFAQDPPSLQRAQPIAWIYENGHASYEVLQWVRTLGKTNEGKEVSEAIIRSRDGKIQRVAIKPARSDLLKEAADLLAPVYAEDQGRTIHFQRSGMKLVHIQGRAILSSESVALSSIAEGSGKNLMSALRLSDAPANLEDRIDTINKLIKQTLGAMALLSKHGLVHGDIRFENILYKTKDGLHANAVDPKTIRFLLSDFDTLTHEGKEPKGISWLFASPELFTRQKIAATAANDLYALGVSSYYLSFGVDPIEEYLKDPASRRFRTEIKLFHAHEMPKEKPNQYLKSRIFSDPTHYSDFWHWVEERFDKIPKTGLPPRTVQKLRDLQAFTLQAMKYSPEERIQAFPAIHCAAGVSGALKQSLGN